MNKELVTGILFAAAVVGAVAAIGGTGTLVYIGISAAVGLTALFLFERQSKAAKGGAAAIFPAVLSKLLMPRKARQGIDALAEREKYDRDQS